MLVVEFAMSNQKDSGLGEQNRQSDKCRTCGCWMPIHHFSDVDNISGKRLAKCVECQLKARIDGAFRNRKSLARTDIAKLCIGCLKSYEKWYDTVKKLDKQKRNEKHENSMFDPREFSFCIMTLRLRCQKSHFKAPQAQ